MAMYQWIYGTATLRGDQGDLRIRLCGEGLRAYTDALTELSRRLLGLDYRSGARDRLCWFAGHLDRELFIVAVGGGQEALLGPERPIKGGFRGQFSVLAYGLTGEDLARCEPQAGPRDTALFEPLKAYLWELSNGQHPPLWTGSRDPHQRVLRRPPQDHAPNIFPASPAQDNALWANSATRPAALGLLSPVEARKLLDLLPNAAVTVAGGPPACFYAPPGSTGLPSAKELKETARQAELEQEARSDAAGPEPSPLSGRPPEEADWHDADFQPDGERLFSSLRNAVSRITSRRPKTENTNTQRWERIEGIAGKYKEELTDQQLDTVERLIEASGLRGVRAICPVELVQYWCWVRLWLGAHQNKEEKFINNQLASFINQTVRKTHNGLFLLDDQLRYCETVINVAEQVKREEL